MQELCARLGASRNAGEKAMHELLRDSILPPLITSVEARAKAILKARALEAAPRKRSDRLQVVAGRKEEVGGIASDQLLFPLLMGWHVQGSGFMHTAGFWSHRYTRVCFARLESHHLREQHALQFNQSTMLAEKVL